MMKYKLKMKKKNMKYEIILKFNINRTKFPFYFISFFSF